MSQKKPEENRKNRPRGGQGDPSYEDERKEQEAKFRASPGSAGLRRSGSSDEVGEGVEEPKQPPTKTGRAPNTRQRPA